MGQVDPTYLVSSEMDVMGLAYSGTAMSLNTSTLRRFFIHVFSACKSSVVVLSGEMAADMA